MGAPAFRSKGGRWYSPFLPEREGSEEPRGPGANPGPAKQNQSTACTGGALVLHNDSYTPCGVLFY